MMAEKFRIGLMIVGQAFPMKNIRRLARYLVTLNLKANHPTEK